MFCSDMMEQQSGKCIAFTHIAHFKKHRRCDTKEAARTLFTDRGGTRSLHLAGRQAGLASRRLETASPYSLPSLILMHDSGTALPL